MSNSKYQTEIGIIQKKILAFKPCYAKLKIPAFFGMDDETTVDIVMPLHISITYGDVVIPKGTKVIIQAVQGNYNDLKIIGFYDKPKNYDFINMLSKYLIGDPPEPHLPKDYGVYPYDEV